LDELDAIMSQRGSGGNAGSYANYFYLDKKNDFVFYFIVNMKVVEE